MVSISKITKQVGDQLALVPFPGYFQTLFIVLLGLIIVLLQSGKNTQDVEQLCYFVLVIKFSINLQAFVTSGMAGGSGFTSYWDSAQHG